MHSENLDYVSLFFLFYDGTADDARVVCAGNFHSRGDLKLSV